MPGQNNMYGSQDDPFGYGQQQAYWQKQRADDASAAKPVPIKQSVPTTPQVQPRMPDRSLRRDRPDLMPINFGGQPYQSPYGRGYVPPNGGTQPLPNPGTQGGGKVVNKAVNTGLVWRTGPNGERVNIPFDAIGTPLDPQSPNYQPITVGPTPPPGFDNIQIPPWAVQPMPNPGTWNPPTQPMPSPIWNGPVPPKQELPDDIYGFSKIYGKPIPEGQKWADVRPDRGYAMPYNPWGGQQGQWQTQAVPQWYGARLNQVR